ncbi:hypothetical protein [Marinomonas pollencensis]|uniref:hypothetical protein n=1 Tax=Marinomonas pollencensis TaxID=491954 RepID=UPI0015F264AB|nr:hypothetical protein [Marinomonas pollencensis]
MSSLFICLLAASAFIWHKSNPTISVVQPNDIQRQEMIGVKNTPSIPLTPL